MTSPPPTIAPHRTFSNLTPPCRIFTATYLVLPVFARHRRPNERMDKLLSKHVMALHAGTAGSGANTTRMAEDSASNPFAGADGYEAWNSQAGVSLAVRLREAAAKLTDGQLLPPPLLRKYIAYARAHVQPVLSTAARDVIEAFYLQLRGKQRGGDSVPVAHARSWACACISLASPLHLLISSPLLTVHTLPPLQVTTRQLESLIRLAEARARMDLREEVTEADAQDAVAVVRAREGLPP